MSKSNVAPRSFLADFKVFFLRGLVVLLPSVLTLWIVVKAYQFIDSAIAQPINGGIRVVMHNATPHWKVLSDRFEPDQEDIDSEMTRLRAEGARRLPDENAIRSALRQRFIQDWWDTRFFGMMNLVGIFVAITGVYIAGRLLGGFFGRHIYRRLERALTTVPIFKQVYPSVKQVVDFLFGQDRSLQFSRVVLIEYPRKGLWSVGFVTSSAMRSLPDSADENTVTVFVPSAPTPFTGYTVIVRQNEVLDISMNIDDALRFIISAGVLVPKALLPPGIDAEDIRQPGSPLPSGLIPITDEHTSDASPPHPPTDR